MTSSYDSVWSQSWRHVELTVSVESKIFIQSCGWLWFHFIKIHNLPSLVESTVFLPCNDRCSFSVSAFWNIKYSSILNVHDVTWFEFPDLPPFWGSFIDLCGFTCTLSFDINATLIFPLTPDSSWLLVEVPNLSAVAIWSLYHKFSVTTTTSDIE